MKAYRILPVFITLSLSIFSMEREAQQESFPTGTIHASVSSDSIAKRPKVTIPSELLKQKDAYCFLKNMREKNYYKCCIPKEGSAYLESVAEVIGNVDDIEEYMPCIVTIIKQEEDKITDFMLDITPYINRAFFNKILTNTVFYDVDQRTCYIYQDIWTFVPVEYDEKIHTQVIPCLIITTEHTLVPCTAYTAH